MHSSFYLMCLVAACAIFGMCQAIAIINPAMDRVQSSQAAEAQAAAITNAASAAASAAKIDAANWPALERYGWQIGAPLLAKNYGPLNNLYAASLPPRSFVGQIDPSFQKRPYNGVRFVSGSSIGVAAV